MQIVAQNEILIFMLIFARIGSAVSAMPGIGDKFVPVNIRIIICFSISAIIFPLIKNNIEITTNYSNYFMLIGKEIIIGLIFGLFAKIIISSIHTAGIIISMQSGLSAAMLFDPTHNTQSSAEGNFLSNIVIAMFFICNLHHIFLQGMFESYELFHINADLMIGDIAEFMSKASTKSFEVAFKIASPILIINTSIFLSAGLLSRLMPSIQIFFILTPIQIMVSFWIMLITISGIMIWYIDYFAFALKNMSLN